jgi:hypothetical protein
MNWNSFVTVIGHLTIAIVMSLLLIFVSLNVVFGCESWTDPSCVTPVELFGGDF